MGKRRGPDIFDDNPLTEDFLEWMVSPDGQTAGEVSGLVFATLENASVDAKRRKIIWADGERLSIEQSAERIRAEHPDRPRELIEISLCSWFEHRVPESGSERQINELDRLFGPWIRDRERKSRAAKNDREVRTLKAVSTPVSRHVVAEEAQHCDAEVLEGAVALVVGGMSVHQPP